MPITVHWYALNLQQEAPSEMHKLIDLAAASRNTNLRSSGFRISHSTRPQSIPRMRKIG